MKLLVIQNKDLGLAGQVEISRGAVARLRTGGPPDFLPCILVQGNEPWAFAFAKAQDHHFFQQERGAAFSPALVVATVFFKQVHRPDGGAIGKFQAIQDPRSPKSENPCRSQGRGRARANSSKHLGKTGRVGMGPGNAP